jgi:hypothetical protein
MATEQLTRKTVILFEYKDDNAVMESITMDRSDAGSEAWHARCEIYEIAPASG